MNTTPPEATTLDAADTRERQVHDTDWDSGDSRRARNRAYVAGCFLAAAAVGGVLLLSGGGDEPQVAPTTPPAPVTSNPATTPTVSTASTAEDFAAEAAQARYLDYLRVTDQVANSGYTDLSAYDAVAVDPETGVLLLGARQDLRDGITGNSDTAVLSLTVLSVELDAPGQYPSVRLLACLDVSRNTAVDAAGDSVRSPDFPDRLRSEVVVQDIPAEAFADGRQPGWYVAEVVQRGEPC